MNRRRQNKVRKRVFKSSIIIFLVILLVVLFVGNMKKKESPLQKPPVKEQAMQKEKENIDFDIKQQKEKNLQEGTNKKGYKVKSGEMVDIEYFDDAVFIGDSRTEALAMFSGLTNSTFHAYKGFSVEKVLSKALVNTETGPITVIDALQKESFSKIYIMFGFNELGWQYPDIFIKEYEEVLQKILEMQEGTIIYVQSILPVTKEYSQKSEYETNERINMYNAMLEDMCERLGKSGRVYFLDVREDIQDTEGALPKESSFDGVHLTKDYVLVWLKYLKTHTVH